MTTALHLGLILALAFAGSVVPEPENVSQGTATYCAPTPTHCQTWGGDAHVGAMRSFRYGDKPYRVRVCHEGACTVVRVVSFCQCENTLIDLSPAAFQDLAPLSRGRIVVHLTRLNGPEMTLPPTDTEPVE